MYRVSNWLRYQHYKNRNPPWIKLHYEILHSRDWLFASDYSKLQMVICLLVASRHDGNVPDDPEYIKRMAGLSFTPDLSELVDMGFLVQEGAKECKNDANLMQKECKNDALEVQNPDKSLNNNASTLLATAPKSLPEERREDNKKTCASSDARFPDFWAVYPTKRNKKKAREIWKRKRLDKRADELIQDVQRRIAKDSQWKGGYIPLPTTYLNGERWEDELGNGGTKELGVCPDPW